jgi:hypothetical protein
MIDSSLVMGDPSQFVNDPSVPNPIPLTVGAFYTFQGPNVTLEMHTHTDANVHFTVVVSGSFQVTRQSTGTTIANAGDVLDFQPNDPHSIMSLTAGTIVNVTKYGTTIPTLAASIKAATADVGQLAAIVAQLAADLAALPQT